MGHRPGARSDHPARAGPPARAGSARCRPACRPPTCSPWVRWSRASGPTSWSRLTRWPAPAGLRPAWCWPATDRCARLWRQSHATVLGFVDDPVLEGLYANALALACVSRGGGLWLHPARGHCPRHAGRGLRPAGFRRDPGEGALRVPPRRRRSAGRRPAAPRARRRAARAPGGCGRAALERVSWAARGREPHAPFWRRRGDDRVRDRHGDPRLGARARAAAGAASSASWTPAPRSWWWTAARATTAPSSPAARRRGGASGGQPRLRRRQQRGPRTRSRARDRALVNPDVELLDDGLARAGGRGRRRATPCSCRGCSMPTAASRTAPIRCPARSRR